MEFIFRNNTQINKNSIGYIYIYIGMRLKDDGGFFYFHFSINNIIDNNNKHSIRFTHSVSVSIFESINYQYIEYTGGVFKL